MALTFSQRRATSGAMWGRGLHILVAEQLLPLINKVVCVVGQVSVWWAMPSLSRGRCPRPHPAKSGAPKTRRHSIYCGSNESLTPADCRNRVPPGHWKMLRKGLANYSVFVPQRITDYYCLIGHKIENRLCPPEVSWNSEVPSDPFKIILWTPHWLNLTHLRTKAKATETSR